MVKPVDVEVRNGNSPILMRGAKSHVPSAYQMPQIVKQGTSFQNAPAQGLVQKSWHENGDGNHVDPELYLTVALVAVTLYNLYSPKNSLWNCEIQTNCRSKSTQTWIFLSDSSSYFVEMATWM